MNSTGNKWSVVLAAAVLHAVVAGSAQAQTAAGREIAIGAIVPSSGPFAEWGRSNTVTLKMFEQQVNKAGGINGARLKVIILDDATKPAQAASSLRKLAGDEKVIAVAGPLTSSAAEVTFPVANEMKVVSMSQASSKPGVAKANRPWAFQHDRRVDPGEVDGPLFQENLRYQDRCHHLRRQGRDGIDRRHQDHARRDERKWHQDRKRNRSAFL